MPPVLKIFSRFLQIDKTKWFHMHHLNSCSKSLITGYQFEITIAIDHRLVGGMFF